MNKQLSEAIYQYSGCDLHQQTEPSGTNERGCKLFTPKQSQVSTPMFQMHTEMHAHTLGASPCTRGASAHKQSSPELTRWVWPQNKATDAQQKPESACVRKVLVVQQV